VVSAFVLVPANAAAIGFIKCVDVQCDFVFVRDAAITAFGSKRIGFTSSHRCCDGIATITGEDSKHGMLHHPKADIGEAVPQILRRWLQTQRPSCNNVADLHLHDITATQLAVDRGIEQRPVTQSSVLVEKETDRPYIAGLEWALGANHIA